MANPACYVNGIMNTVEFDVGNFRKWLLGTAPGGTGPLVSYSGQNGYLVYFSDRRGMLPDPNNGNLTSGEYGFEDVINSASPTGTPDRVMNRRGRRSERHVPAGAQPTSVTASEWNEQAILT